MLSFATPLWAETLLISERKLKDCDNQVKGWGKTQTLSLMVSDFGISVFGSTKQADIEDDELIQEIYSIKQII